MTSSADIWSAPWSKKCSISGRDFPSFSFSRYSTKSAALRAWLPSSFCAVMVMYIFYFFFEFFELYFVHFQFTISLTKCSLYVGHLLQKILDPVFIVAKLFLDFFIAVPIMFQFGVPG